MSKTFKYPVVALYSPAPQSGKSTVTDLIEEKLEWWPAVCSFAEPIKNMAASFLESCGVEDDCLFDPTLKEVIIPEVGVTPRYLMQTLGTEWGRQYLGDIWVKIMERNLAKALDYFPILIDDLRFPNELEMIKSFDNHCLIKVVRPSVEYSGTHSSEGSLDSFTFDKVIINDGTLGDLNDKVTVIVEELKNEFNL